MSEPAAEIERIVRQVMAEMGLLPAARLPAPADAGPQQGNGQAPSPPAPLALAGGESSPGDWTVAGRVVTLADLPPQWNGVRRVVAPPRAVVTPSVRDELQRRNIALVFGLPAAPDPAMGGAGALLISAGSYDPAALVSVLAGDGFPIRPERTDCLIAATDKLAQDLAAGASLGLLVTRHATAAMCLANRRPGVRAILGAKAESIAADAEAVGANLLVLDPAAGGLFALRQMARQFLRGGVRPCPKVFEKHLS